VRANSLVQVKIPAQTALEFHAGKSAPLDNNVVERALKKAIPHRKNALFYKTMNGAREGIAS
jgi:hypothetical protein